MTTACRGGGLWFTRSTWGKHESLESQSMTPAVTVQLIAATVELEQPLAGGMRTVGTGFLISDPTPDGQPRVVLVTANHVFERMKGDEATIGYRVQQPDGSWSYAPQK